jgi:hypothetical protein
MFKLARKITINRLRIVNNYDHAHTVGPVIGALYRFKLVDGSGCKAPHYRSSKVEFGFHDTKGVFAFEMQQVKKTECRWS